MAVCSGNGTRNLSEGLKAEGVYTGDGILESGVKRLRNLADSREVTPDYG